MFLQRVRLCYLATDLTFCDSLVIFWKKNCRHGNQCFNECNVVLQTTMLFPHTHYTHTPTECDNKHLIFFCIKGIRQLLLLFERSVFMAKYNMHIHAHTKCILFCKK